MDYSSYYNDHPDYQQLRKKNSEFYKQYLNSIKYWKNKYLFDLVKDQQIETLCEVGCATGILLAAFPSVTPQNQRYGIDISELNIEIAKKNYPEVKFFASTFESFVENHSPGKFDLIILSDILEHVENDVGMLRLAADHAHQIVLNLPLEKCPEFMDREWGIHDKHGHLRAYDLQEARELVTAAGLCEKIAMVKQYVLEPVFKQYLAEKLFENKTGDKKLLGISQYITELNHIELEPGYYKSNYFALLCHP